MPDRFQARIETVLKGTGIQVNGPESWDPQIRDPRFYGRVFAEGSLGLGETYMDGWWDCERIDEFIARLLRADVSSRFAFNVPALFDAARARMTNLQSRSRAFRVGKAHYDIGNDLYRAMLDSRMTYSCGYWKDAKTIDEAQEAKLDLVCRKIGLKAGDRVLDIGCGWGSFAKFAAERYGASVVGVTISEEQLKLGRELCAGLPVDLWLQDYRDLDGSFDHVISIGMAEHVGYKNYRTYFEVARRCLKDGGFFLLHAIGANRSGAGFDPWMERYIFPNAMLPSAKQLSAAAEGLFVMEDWHNFGAYYDNTLMAWHANVERHWGELGERYHERFRRMWRYYLLSCAGTFRARYNQLWQIVYSKNGIPGGYISVR